jgi:hypothetical protein
MLTVQNFKKPLLIAAWQFSHRRMRFSNPTILFGNYQRSPSLAILAGATNPVKLGSENIRVGKSEPLRVRVRDG